MVSSHSNSHTTQATITGTAFRLWNKIKLDSSSLVQFSFCSLEHACLHFCLLFSTDEDLRTLRAENCDSEERRRWPGVASNDEVNACSKSVCNAISCWASYDTGVPLQREPVTCWSGKRKKKPTSTLEGIWFMKQENCPPRPTVHPSGSQLLTVVIGACHERKKKAVLARRSAQGAPRTIGENTNCCPCTQLCPKKTKKKRKYQKSTK